MALPEKNNHGGDGQGRVPQPWNGRPDGSAYYQQTPDYGGIKDQAEQVLDLMLRRKWLILTTCIAVLGAAVIYTYSQKPLYQATSLVLVSGQERDQQASTQYGPNDLFARSDRSLQNELIILRTSQSLRRSVGERLIEEGMAARLFHSSPESGLERAVDRIWSQIAQLGGEAQTDASEGKPPSVDSTSLSVGRVAAVAAGSVRFGQTTEGANVIRITAQNSDPRMAAALANAYMHEYLERTQKASRARLSASRQFLEKQAAKRKEELQAIEQKIQAFKSDQGAVALDQEGSNLVNRIAETEAARDEARLTLRMEETALKSLREEMDSISPEQLSRRVGSAIEKEIEALQSQVAELELSKRQLQMESDPASAAQRSQSAQIERRIRRLRTEVDSLSDVYVSEVMEAGVSADEGVQRVKDLKQQIAEKRIDIAGLRARIDVLTNRLREYENELRSIPQQSMQLAQLERSREYTEQMYGFLVEQLQQTRVQEESELGYADQITEASVPGGPIQPQPQRNLFLGLILGLLGGVGLALVRDQLDNRVYKPDRIGQMGYREVGVIPNITPVIEDRLQGQTAVDHNETLLQSNLISAVEPNSAAAEAYRHVRTNIQFGPDRDLQTLLVTSPGAGDGKSTTAANLAIVMAQAGRSTLLVDTDLRRPQVHKLFGMSRSPGLTEALQSTLEDHIKMPPIENLSVLPAGANVANPSELLGSGMMQELLEGARERFDIVILDTPPVLAATDATLLSTQCDTTLCVVRAGTTTEPELERAMQALNDVGARVMGAIFNGFDVSMAYGYKYRYRDYGRYGPYDQYKALPDKA
jgi:capsular exopolysaccharide synthesis family protein